MNVVAGVYQLRMRVRKERTIDVGALGSCRFPRGWYVYTGSARGGLYQRVSRHLREDKRMHWHIDHLLAVSDCVEAFVLPDPHAGECALHDALREAETPIPGFGASDCKCRSHLAYFASRPAIGLTPWETFVRTCDPGRPQISTPEHRASGPRPRPDHTRGGRRS